MPVKRAKQSNRAGAAPKVRTSKTKEKVAKARSTRPATGKDITQQVADALAWLERKSTRRDRENLVRFGIAAPKAFGVSMANMKVLGKQLGRDHELAAALWDTGWYEARMVTSFVDDPALVTPEQMDRWCSDFDNWGICDTVCFHLFDRTPHAFAKVKQWSGKREEFVKRGAFALLASLALHDKQTGDALFLDSLVFVERAADDDRNFVRKGVSWALRSIGRRSTALNVAAVTLSRRLAASEAPAARTTGKEALKELTSKAVTGRLSPRR